MVSAMWPYNLTWSEWFHQVGLLIVLPVLTLAFLLAGISWFLGKRRKK